MIKIQQSRKSLRSILFAALVLVMGVTACSPANIPNTVSEGTLSVPPAAVLKAVEQLSQTLGVTVEDIEIKEFEPVEWPDACLGIPQEGQACAQVVTPGFRVQAEVNGQQYELRSDQEGTLVVQAPEEK